MENSGLQPQAHLTQDPFRESLNLRRSRIGSYDNRGLFLAVTLAELVVDAVVKQGEFFANDPSDSRPQISDYVTCFHPEARSWHFDSMVAELLQYERLPNPREGAV